MSRGRKASFFSSRRRHTSYWRDWIQTCALPIYLDFDLITQARADAPLLADLEVNLPHLVKNLGRRASGVGRGGRKRRPAKFDPATNGVTPHAPRPMPQLPAVGPGVEEGDPLAIDPELARRWLVSFLKDEVVVRRRFKRGIEGLR